MLNKAYIAPNNKELNHLKHIFIGLFLLAFSQLYSQEFSVTGKVINTNNQALAYANILLLTANDSTVVKGTSTGEFGKFAFNQVVASDYLLKISYLGYVEKLTTISVKNDTDTGNHVIDESTEDLDEISIIAKRPTLTREADRLRFNVVGTSLIEGSVLQVLKSTPSLLVMDGEIKLKNQPVTVYINNRKINLNSVELSEFLSSAPANSIKSVEVITNPPASYDASGGAVVNIIMDKNLVAGYRGSIATKYTQGIYPRYNASTSHFFRGKNSGLNITYSYNKNKINRESDYIVNYLNEDNSIDRNFDSNIIRTNTYDNHSLSLNYDLNLNDRNTINLSSHALLVPKFKYKIKNETIITDMNGELLRSFNSDNLTNDDKYNISLDADWAHNFKSKGKIVLSGHATIFDYNRLQKVENTFFDEGMTLQDESEFSNDNDQLTKIYASKLDYSLPINDSSNFETGLKFSTIITESSVKQHDIINGNELPDETNTNAFDYDEKIGAAYMNYSKDWEKWSTSIGLRAEYTELEGVSLSDNLINTQDYLEWFPTASLQYQISEKFNVYVNYDRGIRRPDFRLLNPFRIFLNENTIVTGNPQLKPVIMNHAVFGLTLFENFVVEAYYQISDQNIHELARQDNEENNIVYTPLNLDKSIDYGFDFSMQQYLTDNWFFYAVTSFYNFTDRTNFDGQNVEIGRWSNYTVLNSNLRLLKDRSLSLDITGTFVGKTVQGLQTVDDRVFSTISLSKSLFKRQATLALTAENLFNTGDARTRTRYLNQSNFLNDDNDISTVSLSFRYRFGNTKLGTNERTTTNDERKRLGSDNH